MAFEKSLHLLSVPFCTWFFSGQVLAQKYYLLRKICEAGDVEIFITRSVFFEKGLIAIPDQLPW